MARRADIELSMQDNRPTSADLMAEQMAANIALSDARLGVPETPVASSEKEEYIIFKLVNGSRKGRLNVDGIDDVINPATGKVERVRLLRGVDTIWAKEQKDLSENYVKENRRSLLFEGKFCRIPKSDAAAVEFAKVCRSFIESPTYKKRGSRHAFFEWNPARQAEEAAKKNELKLRAMKIALSEQDMEKVCRHAHYLGVRFTDEFGTPYNDEGIRNFYFAKAEQDPKTFMESCDHPIVNIAYMVKKAISDNKIDLGRAQGSAFWAASGGFIAQIPQSRMPAEYLTELAMTSSKEGKLFLDTLQTISS